MSISKNFPSIVPSLNLNFARSQDLDPRITFTRGSSATYVDDTGLIRTAGTNQARFDHDPVTLESLGLLIEESRTNLLLRSQEFDNASYTKGNVTVTANSTIAPDGTTSADTLTRTSSGSIYQDVSGQSGTGTYTHSIFLKAGTDTRISLAGWLFGGTAAENIINQPILINTSTGEMTLDTRTAGSSSTITKYPNGWYRISCTGTGTNATNTILRIELYFNGNTSVIAWGAQSETAAFPTSYIPTTSATVTRSADSASITGTNFTSWFNNSEGTLYASIRNQTIRSTITYDGFCSLNGSDANTDIMRISTQTASGGGAQNQFVAGIAASNVNTMDTGITGSPTNIGRAILAYKSNDAAFTVNGLTPVTDTSVTIPTCVELRIFGTGRYQPAPTGHMTHLSYYPVRLPNAQLQALTK